MRIHNPAITGSLTLSGSNLTINSVGTISGSATSTGSFGKVIGATVHWVIPAVDAGPIIAQLPHKIFKGTSLERVKEDVHLLEHYLYPKTIKELLAVTEEAPQVKQVDKTITRW